MSMQKAQESEMSIHRAKIYWEQAKQDLEMAKSLIKKNPDTSCLLSNQAAINGFSSILFSKGFFQIPAYSSIEMLNLCSSVFPELEKTPRKIIYPKVKGTGKLPYPVRKLFLYSRHIPH